MSNEPRGARLPPRHTTTAARLAGALVLSGVLHGAALAGAFAWIADEERAERAVVVVELASGAGQDPPPAGGGAAQELSERGVADRPAQGEALVPPAEAEIAASDARLESLVAERDALAAELRAEAAARARLGGEVASLQAEHEALASELAQERERAAGLAQALAEQHAAEEARLREVRGTHEALVAALRDEIADQQIALGEARDGLAVSIVDRVLFPSGQATLTDEGRAIIDKVAGALTTASPGRIIVEGHTDDVPVGPDLRGQFASNWELSAARATEVVRHLVERGLPPLALEAVGRADTRPVASNDTESGRRRNRRIEIVLPTADGPGPTPAS